MKNKHLVKILALLSLPFIFAACEDIFEDDLSKVEMIIVAPSDGITTNESVGFFWEETKGARQYQLQVAVPDFNNPVRIVLDTVITTYRLDYTLAPGNYQWKVRAINGSSATQYKTYSLKID